jgi:CRISPR-associated protein Csb1
MALTDLLREGLGDEYVTGKPAGIEFRQRLVPPYGQVTMPPVYELPLEIHPRSIDGSVRRVTELDSVGSSANRLEERLLDEHRGGRYGLPLADTTITAAGQTFVITTLEAPHRLFDAWIRLSELSGTNTTFEDSDQGREVSLASPGALDPILETSAHDLLFGTWDSHRTGPSGQVRIARSLTTTVLGLDPEPVVTVAARRDPLNLGEAKDVKAPKGMKLSEQGLSSIPPQRRRPGVSIAEALFTGFLSFASLRRLRFARYDDLDARLLLACLALHAISLRVAEGWSLRSECELIPDDELQVLVRRAGNRDAEPLAVTPDEAAAAFSQARQQLGIEDRSVHLVGGSRLTPLVERAAETVAAHG